MHPDLDTAKNIEDIIFKDPLSELTRRIRRNLIFAGSLAALIQVYQLQIKSVPWLNIEVPENAPHLLDGMLTISVIYLLFVFIVYAWQDIRRWVLASQILSIQNFFKRFKDFSQYLYRVQDHLGKIAEEKQKNDPMFGIARKLTDEALDKMPEPIKTLGKMESTRKQLSFVQWFRLIFIEIFIPIAVGIFAIYKNSETVPKIFVELFK